MLSSESQLIQNDKYKTQLCIHYLIQAATCPFKWINVYMLMDMNNY